MKTKHRLEMALRDADAPQWMCVNALNGVYDDYESKHAAPINLLVSDCRANGLSVIAERAIAGEFDGTREEAETWAKTEEGQAAINRLTKEKP